MKKKSKIKDVKLLTDMYVLVHCAYKGVYLSKEKRNIIADELILDENFLNILNRIDCSIKKFAKQ